MAEDLDSSRWARWGVLLLIVVAGLVLLRFGGTSEPQPASQLPLAEVSGAPGYSNVRHEDYVGPRLCNDCHEERYQQWSTNLHRKMNRLASEEGAVLGDFDDRRVPYADGVLLLSKEADGYFMSFEREGKVHRRYRVTRTIGSRYLQEYVGIQELGPEASGDSVYTTEIRLPFGYLFRTNRWLPQQYFDSWHGEEYAGDDTPSEDAYAPDQAPWRGRCAWCHNTYAFDKRLARLHGERQKGSGIEQLFEDSAPPNPEISEDNLLPTDELVSVGISCESCHFGAREHAIDGQPIRFSPANELVQGNRDAPTLAGTREDSRTIVAICAQCHSAPTGLYPNGAGTRNSSEALDLLSGACASRIKCTDCHDPHVPGPGAMAPLQPKHVEVCLGCHQNLADAEVAAAHSKHTGEVSCLDCHMPRIVQGVSSLLRTHRIGSPTDVSMLEEGVNACNLCHLDQSVTWTARELNKSYGQSLDLALLDDEPAALQWLESEVRIHRLTVAGALGISPLGRKYLPELLDKLNDPVAYDRLRYLWAVEEALGRKLSEAEFSVMGTPEWRRNQSIRLRKELKSVASEKRPSEPQSEL